MPGCRQRHGACCKRFMGPWCTLHVCPACLSAWNSRYSSCGSQGSAMTHVKSAQPAAAFECFRPILRSSMLGLGCEAGSFSHEQPDMSHPVTWQVSTVFQGFNSLSRPSQLHATFMLCLTCFEVLLFFASWQYLLDSMLMTVCLAPLTSPDVVS